MSVKLTIAIRVGQWRLTLLHRPLTLGGASGMNSRCRLAFAIASPGRDRQRLPRPMAPKAAWNRGIPRPMRRVIAGQDYFLERLLVELLANSRI